MQLKIGCRAYVVGTVANGIAFPTLPVSMYVCVYEQCINIFKENV